LIGVQDDGYAGGEVEHNRAARIVMIFFIGAASNGSAAARSTGNDEVRMDGHHRGGADHDREDNDLLHDHHFF
jgi:hypothetical protein